MSWNPSPKKSPSLSGPTRVQALWSNLNVAKQTCEVLYQEVQKNNQRIQDTTLKKASANVAGITPSRYLRQFHTLRGHSEKIVQVKWSADSEKVLTCCQDGFMIVWEAVSGLKLEAIPLINDWVLLCAYAPSGRVVALAGLDNKCTVYRLKDFGGWGGDSGDSIELRDRPNKQTRSHAAYVSACEFLSDTQLLTGSGDMSIGMWDMEKHCKVREFLGHVGDVMLLLISPRERMNPTTFLSAGADGCVKLWDKRVQKVQHSCNLSKKDLNSVSHLANGHSFVAGDGDGICKLYDLRSQCELERYNLREQFEISRPGVPASPISPTSMRSCKSQSLTFDSPGVSSLDVSISGRVLYACYADYGCIAWDLLREEIIELIGIGSGSHTDRVSEVRCSPDGQALATASWDNTVKIWST